MGCARLVSRPCTHYQEGREARGVTLEELASRTGIALVRLAEFEAGATPTGRELHLLSMALGLPLGFFHRPARTETTEWMVCGSGVTACAHPGCGQVSDWLCDYPTGRGRTCDLPLCDEHRTRHANGLDYCPTHVLMVAGKEA